MDALDKICDDLRDIARVFFPEGYGTIYFPRRDNPSMVLEVHDHKIKFARLMLQDDNGIDVEKKYKAD